MATLEELQAHLRAANAPWQAGETSMSALTVEERRRKLGVVPPPAAVVAGERAAAVAPGAAAPPSEYSWRDHGGVTPVRDQGDCGSCVSFACCAATESQALIDRNVTLDLSEADAHFCSSHGATCCGWWPGDCLTDLAGRGVVREMDFPYEAAPTGQVDPNCQNTWAVQCLAVAGRDEKTTVITGQATYTSTTAMKQRISTTGPVVSIQGWVVSCGFGSRFSGLAGAARGRRQGPG